MLKQMWAGLSIRDVSAARKRKMIKYAPFISTLFYAVQGDT
jgi:hypothetical protein